MEEIIDFVNQYTNHYRTSTSTREIAKTVKLIMVLYIVIL